MYTSIQLCFIQIYSRKRVYVYLGEAVAAGARVVLLDAFNVVEGRRGAFGVVAHA